MAGTAVATEGKVAIITFAEHYVGPPAVAALLAEGFRVAAHSLAFAAAADREKWERANPGATALAALEPADAVSEALERFGRLDAAVSNDVPLELCDGATAGIDRTDFAKVVELLLLRPQRFISAAIAAMRAGGGGSVVAITSGATTRLPYHASDGNGGYVSARAGVNAMAKHLAVQHGAENIQVNVIAPFYLYSQLAFPSPIGADDPAYRERLDTNIPMKRFGRPEEIGELVALLASGRSRFTTGQVIAFSGGGA